ncbi:hypothetical protein ACNKF0_09270 [Nocardioides sp. T5]|uniref:hypothetical protein n=1 Tax=Nocardioides sp. T5 TaxID=3400182 RepID=UPI003A8713D4
MHLSTLRYFADDSGWRRGWADRAGQRLDHGTPPFEAIVERAHEWFNHIVHAAITKGPHKGKSRLEVYAEAVADGVVYTGPTLTVEDEADLAEFVCTRKYDETRGIYFNNAYYLSRQLASRAVEGQELHIRQLLNPDVLYVFDESGKFLASATARDDADPADQHGLLQDRAAREQFVEKARTVRAIRSQAQAVEEENQWAEVADALADAAEVAEALADTQHDDTRHDDTRHDDTRHDDTASDEPAPHDSGTHVDE